MYGDTTAPTRPVQIRAGTALIDGDLTIPPRAAGLVVFAHGSGSSRFSRRNRAVARRLEDGAFATLLLDLLTREEESVDVHTSEYRFDIDRLGHRVVAAIDWLPASPISPGCRSPVSGRARAPPRPWSRPRRVPTRSEP